MNSKTLCANQLSCVRQDKLIFKNISFELHSGNALIIEGENGAGKSSLLRLLSGLSTPFSGEIVWQNKVIQASNANYADALHYIGHMSGVKLSLTVAENLELIMRLHDSSSRAREASVAIHLQLTTHEHVLAKNLSAGQKRRLALAKLFLIPKTLWILDEPLAALDVTMQTLFLLHLEKHLEQGGMAIISTHHPIHLKKHHAQVMRLGS